MTDEEFEKQDKSFWDGFNCAKNKMQKRIAKLEAENAELKEEINAKCVVLNDFRNRVEVVTERFNKKSSQLSKLEAEKEELKEKLFYAKVLLRELLDNSNEYTRQNAEDFIKE